MEGKSMHTACPSTAFLCAAVCFIALSPHVCSGWQFGNQTEWNELPGSMCGQMEDQSPTDIWTTEDDVAFPMHVSDDGRTTRMGPVSWSFTWPMVNVSLGWNARRSWEMQLLPPYDNATTVSFYDRDFLLRSVQFTSPSENRIEGEGFDMEVQHVLEHGVGDDKKLLIVSVLLQVGLVPDNPYFSEIWNDFPAYNSPSRAKFVTNPFYGAFPRDKSFFAFPGSLTHPPCTNETIWVVFQTPVLISRKQRDLYRKSLNASSTGGFFRYAPGQVAPNGVVEPWDSTIGMNNRKLQLAGNRDVLRFVMSLDSPEKVKLPSNAWAYVVLALVGLAIFVGMVALAIVARQQLKRRKTTRGFVSEDQELLSGGHDSEVWAMKQARRQQKRTRTKSSRSQSEQSSRSRSTVDAREVGTWKPEVDPESGRTYYWHELTRERTWTNPSERREVSSDSSVQDVDPMLKGPPQGPLPRLPGPPLLDLKSSLSQRGAAPMNSQTGRQAQPREPVGTPVHTPMSAAHLPGQPGTPVSTVGQPAPIARQQVQFNTQAAGQNFGMQRPTL